MVWRVLLVLFRGALATLGAIAIIVTLIVEGPDAIERLQDLPIHDIVTRVTLRPSELPWGDIVLWLVATVLVSLMLWLIYSRPKQALDGGYYRQLEGRRPGTTARRQARQRPAHSRRKP